MEACATPFGMPPGALAALGRTRPRAGDARLLGAGLHSRRLVLLRAVLALAERHAVPSPVRQRLHRHWRLLERAEATDPLAVREALAYPSVGNWLARALALADAEEFADFAGGLGALAASAALRAGTGFRLTLPTSGGRLVLPGYGVFDAHAPRVRAVAGPRSLRLTPEDGRGGVALLPPYATATGAGWHGLCPLPGGAALLDDLDPHRTGPAPVGRSAPPITGTGGADARTRDWRSRWRAALTTLGAADPARAAEVGGLVRAVVPLASAPGPVFSATLRAAPWAVLTTMPETARELAGVLVHEVQHSKLAVLTDLVTLHRADASAVHRVPWRPDPRPLGSVVQGTYAHLAMADYWHRLALRRGASPTARSAARRRREDYREQVAPALALLAGSGELTAAGREFTEGMRRHHAALGARGRCRGGTAPARVTTQ